MSSNPLVSVIVTTYERPTLLPRAVNSVLQQTHDNIELIVVDDHSTTDMREPLSDLALDSLSRFEFVRHGENRGGAAARATGIERATGQFLSVLDDDDVIHPEKIERQLQAHCRNDEAAVVYCGVRNVNADGETISVSRPTRDGDVLRDILVNNFIGSCCTLLVHNDAVESAGSPDGEFPSWQAWEWFVRLAQETAFCVVSEPLFVRYNGHGQVSDDVKTKRDVSYPLMRDKYIDLARDLDVESQFRAALCKDLGRSALRNDQFPEGRRWLRRAVAHSPLDLTTWRHLLPAYGGKRTYRTLTRLKRVLDTY